MTLPRYTGVTVQTTTNAPAPTATVTVYLHNTNDKADLFSDEAGATPLANPLTSDAVTGLFTFCVANGLYDLTVTGLTVTPYTIPGVQLVYLGAPVGQVFLSTTVLTHAQILALPTTRLTLVAALGAGTVLSPLYAQLRTTVAAPYTNIDPAAVFSIAYPDSNDTDAFAYLPNDAAITNGSTTLLSDFLAAGQALVRLVPFMKTENVHQWGPVPVVYAPASNLDNQPFQTFCDNGALGNFTGGDPSDTLTITTAYLVL